MTRQEEYWQLSYRLAAATSEAQQAEAAMDDFRRAHVGEEFLVFRPDDIAAAVTPDLAPLDVLPMSVAHRGEL